MCPPEPQNLNHILYEGGVKKNGGIPLEKKGAKSTGANSKSVLSGTYLDKQQKKYFIKKEDRQGPEFAEIWIGVFLDKLIKKTALKEYKENFVLARPGVLHHTPQESRYFSWFYKTQESKETVVIVQDFAEKAKPIVEKRQGMHELLKRGELLEIASKFDDDQFAAVIVLSLLVADYGLNVGNIMAEENGKKPVRVDMGAGLRRIIRDTEGLKIFETALIPKHFYRWDLKYLENWILTPRVKQALAQFLHNHQDIFRNGELIKELADSTTTELFEVSYSDLPVDKLQEIYNFLVGDEANKIKEKDPENLKKLIRNQLSNSIIQRAELMVEQGLNLSTEQLTSASTVHVQVPVADRVAKREIRHNLDVLLKLIVKKDVNETKDFLKTVKNAKSDTKILACGENDYLIVNPALKNLIEHVTDDDFNLDTLYMGQLAEFRISKSRNQNSQISHSYTDVVELLKQPEDISSFLGGLQSKADVKKWALVDELPETMRQKIGGSKRVVAMTCDMKNSGQQEVLKINQTPGNPVFQDDEDLVQKLNAHPVSLTFANEAWFIFAKMSDDGDGVEFLKSKTNDIDGAQIIEIDDVNDYAIKYKTNLTSDVVMKLGEVLKLQDVAFIDSKRAQELEKPQLQQKESLKQ